MKAVRSSLFWPAMLLLLVCVGLVVAQEAPAAGEPPPSDAEGPPAGAEPLVDSAGNVEMVEITLDRRKIRGRLLDEDEGAIRIEGLGGGVIGYRKDRIRDLRRFRIPLSAYYEGRGQFHHERAWQVEDGPPEFIKARQALQKALAHAVSEKDRTRLAARLEALAADREEWQREAVRREEIKKAQHEAELVKLEKELAEEKLDGVRRHEQDIRELQDSLRRMQQQTRSFVTLVEDLNRKVRDIEDDLDRFFGAQRTFITYGIFVDLQRSHEQLRREVDRLERKVERD